MKVLEMLSILALWVVTGLNLWSLLRNIRLHKRLHNTANDLWEAKKNCDDLAQQLNKALDELQNNGVEAAMAVFMEEGAE